MATYAWGMVRYRYLAYEEVGWYINFFFLPCMYVQLTIDSWTYWTLGFYNRNQGSIQMLAALPATLFFVFAYICIWLRRENLFTTSTFTV